MAKKISRGKKALGAVALCKVLSDEHRYHAIGLLAAAKKGGLLVSDLSESLAMGHSATSHLLAFLNDNNIVTFRKEGRAVRYFLSSSAAARTLVRIRKAAS